MSFSNYAKNIGIGLVGASAFLYGAAKMSSGYRSVPTFKEQFECLKEPSKCIGEVPAAYRTEMLCLTEPDECIK